MFFIANYLGMPFWTSYCPMKLVLLTFPSTWLNLGGVAVESFLFIQDITITNQHPVSVISPDIRVSPYRASQDRLCSVVYRFVFRPLHCPGDFVVRDMESVHLPLVFCIPALHIALPHCHANTTPPTNRHQNHRGPIGLG